MCFLFNVRMNHYYSCCCFFLRTLSSLNLTEKAWTKTSKKHIDFTLSVCVSCCQEKYIYMSFAIKQHSRLMHVLELLYTHTLTETHSTSLTTIFACIIFFVSASVFHSFFHVFEQSWKGLKNTKHLMMIKVTRIYTASVAGLCVALNAFPFFQFKWEKKKHQQQHNKIRIHRIKQ